MLRIVKRERERTDEENLKAYVSANLFQESKEIQVINSHFILPFEPFLKIYLPLMPKNEAHAMHSLKQGRYLFFAQELSAFKSRIV